MLPQDQDQCLEHHQLKAQHQQMVSGVEAIRSAQDNATKMSEQLDKLDKMAFLASTTVKGHGM